MYAFKMNLGNNLSSLLIEFKPGGSRYLGHINLNENNIHEYIGYGFGLGLSMIFERMINNLIGFMIGGNYYYGNVYNIELNRLFEFSELLLFL